MATTPRVYPFNQVGVDSTGLALPPAFDSYASAYTYNTDGTLATITKTIDDVSYRKTYAYTTVAGSPVPTFSPAWVKL